MEKWPKYIYIYITLELINPLIVSYSDGIGKMVMKGFMCYDVV